MKMKMMKTMNIAAAFLLVSALSSTSMFGSLANTAESQATRVEIAADIRLTNLDLHSVGGRIGGVNWMDFTLAGKPGLYEMNPGDISCFLAFNELHAKRALENRKKNRSDDVIFPNGYLEILSISPSWVHSSHGDPRTLVSYKLKSDVFLSIKCYKNGVTGGPPTLEEVNNALEGLLTLK